MTAEVAAPRRRWWQHAWAVVGAIIGIVGAITGVIGVLPLVFRDTTDLDDLVVEVESADAEFAPAFAVDADVDWGAFPVSSGACDSAQLAWLSEHGAPLAERYLVSVVNTAKEGATLSLADFRGEGESTTPVPPRVAVVCDQTGEGTSTRAAVLDPSTGRSAVYRQADPSLPDNPLVFNLAPGESGQFVLDVRSGLDVQGRIVFTESFAADDRTVELPIDGGVATVGVGPQRLTVTDGRLACLGADPCDPAAVIAELLAAAGGA